MTRIPKNLIGYCGLYCGACGIYQGRIRQAVENLRAVIGAYGFNKIAPELAKWEPALKHYAEFEKVMDGLVKLFGECPGCIGGDGDPNCKLRECCRQKSYTTCEECVKMETCKNMEQYPWARKELQKVKAMGIEKWAKEMQEKVNEGYCYLDEKIK